MKLKPKVKKVALYSFIALLFLALLSFVGRKQDNRICKKIDVEIEEQYGNYFVDENDVIGLITNGNREPIIGQTQKKIQLKSLELRLKTNKFIQKCEVSRNLRGDLIVFVNQNRPIARVINRSALDTYIGENGEILPMSDNYTARVLPVEIKSKVLLTHLDSLGTKKEDEASYMDVLRYIDGNKFWKTQLAQMFIQENGDIVFLPQIGKQVIEFGKPDNFEEKFRNLNIFYKKIIPEKGWNRYNRVNVSYQNQIVCE